MSYLPSPSSLPPGSIVDSYRRDSGGMRQDKSTDQQLAELEAYCKQYNLIHRHCFVDVAKSGKSTAGRDDFNRMIEAYEIPSNRPAGLLLWNYARFARDIDDAQFNKIRLRQWGITVHSLNDQIPEGDYGRVIEFLIDVSNEEKRKQTSIDARRGLWDLVNKYGCVPGTPPRGFKREPVNLGPRRDKTDHIAHRWVPDPEWIPRVQLAFQMKATGATHHEIHKATQLFGSLNTYGSFFENELYIGKLHFGENTVENYCEPIIDLTTWNTVQQIQSAHKNNQSVIAKNTLHPRRKSEAATYLLSGIAFCTRCNSPLWGMTSGQRDGSYYYRYACTRAKRRRDCDLQPIPARALEAEVIDELTHFFEHPDNLRDLLEASQQYTEGFAEQQKATAKEIQKKLGTIRRSIANITNALATRAGSKSLLAKHATLEAEEIELETDLQRVKTLTPTVPPRLTEEEIIHRSKNLVAQLQSKDQTTVRRVLLATIHLVKVDRTQKQGYCHITFKHRPRDSKTPEESPAIITAFTGALPVGAHLYRRSISFEFKIAPQHITKKSRSR